MRISRFVLVLIAVVLMGVGSAQADTVTTYTSLAAWQAAAGGSLTTEDFADTTLAAGLSATFGGQSSSISGGVLNINGQFFTLNPTIFTFTPATSAFGGDFDLTPGSDGGGLNLIITFANNTTTVVNIPGGTPQFNSFFGVVSNGAAITSLTVNGAAFTGNGESFTLDNLQYVTGSGGGGTPPPPVPEPSTVVLLGAGIGVLFILKSRSA